MFPCITTAHVALHFNIFCKRCIINLVYIFIFDIQTKVPALVILKMDLHLPGPFSFDMVYIDIWSLNITDTLYQKVLVSCFLFTV